jgi:lipid II:glycine glycyltransferase (peptidoglycan interpeptide bridge formation enzyme)
LLVITITREVKFNDLAVQKLSKEESEKFYADQKYVAHTQLAESGKVLELLGFDYVILGLLKDGKPVAAGKFNIYPSFKFFFSATCIQGPILDYYDDEITCRFFTSLKKYMKKRKVIHLMIVPGLEMGLRDEEGNVIEKADWSLIDRLKKLGLKHDGFNNDIHGFLQRWLFIKDLKDSKGNPLKSEEDLLKTYTAKTRNAVKKAEKNQVYVRNIEKDEMPIFHRMLQATSERRNFHSYPLEYFMDIRDAFGPDRIKVFVAFINPPKSKAFHEKNLRDLERSRADLEERLKSNSKLQGRIKELDNQIKGQKKSIEYMDMLMDKGPEIPISTGMFVQANGITTYMYSGSYDEYFSLGGADLIQKYAQIWALENKSRTYNFLGTLGSYCGEDDGIHRFKKGFGGGRVVELPGAFIMFVNPILGRLFHMKNYR